MARFNYRIEYVFFQVVALHCIWHINLINTKKQNVKTNKNFEFLLNYIFVLWLAHEVLRCRQGKLKITEILITWVSMTVRNFYRKFGLTTHANWAFHFWCYALQVTASADWVLADTCYFTLIHSFIQSFFIGLIISTRELYKNPTMTGQRMPVYSIIYNKSIVVMDRSKTIYKSKSRSKLSSKIQLKL